MDLLASSGDDLEMRSASFGWLFLLLIVVWTISAGTLGLVDVLRDVASSVAAFYIVRYGRVRCVILTYLCSPFR